MTMHRKYIPAALQPELRRDYEDSSIPVYALAARAGMTQGSFYRCVKELGWTPRRVDAHGRRLGRTQTRRVTATARPDNLDAQMSAALNAVPAADLPSDVSALAHRIRRNIDRELSALERMRESIDPSDLAKFELAARLLSGFVRSMQEAVRLEQKIEPPKPPQAATAEADDLPRDLNDLRRSLVERIEALVADRADASPESTAG